MPASATLPFPENAATGAFLDALRGLSGHRLAFTYDGRRVHQGYHVTEVKSGRFSGLDCGANPEAWSETIVQLYDVPGIAGVAAEPMSVAKFLAIMAKFESAIGLERQARLTFEVSDADEAIRLYAAQGATIDHEGVVVTLGPVPASCKPRDRWLDERKAAKASCCAAPAAASPSSACCA